MHWPLAERRRTVVTGYPVTARFTSEHSVVTKLSWTSASPSAITQMLAMSTRAWQRHGHFFLHASVTSALRDAWKARDTARAQRQLKRLATSLETDHPGAAASVREGLDALTLQRLGVTGGLYRKLRTTNAIENFNSAIATYSRNVKRWRNGMMVIRWVSAAIVEAEQKFRRVHGWRDITKLVSALGHLEATQEASTERVA